MRAWLIAPLGLGLALMTAGCGDTQGQRATTGALSGVAFGAAVGGPIGALIGGAAGAGVGAERPQVDAAVNTGSNKAQAAVNSAMGDMGISRTASAGTPSVENTAKAAGAADNGPPLSHQQVRQAQTQLKRDGINPGPVDGIYGPRTIAAVKQFQARNNLPQTGALNGLTEQRLQTASANRTQPQNNPQAAQAPNPNAPANGSQTPNANPNPQPNGSGTNTPGSMPSNH